MIIDTNILIDFLRGELGARDFLTALPDDGMPHCSVITVAEIYAGMKESERTITDELIDNMIVLPVTREVAEVAGEIKRDTKGYELELDDCLIAATAIREGVLLATRNAKHYPMLEKELIIPEY